VYRADGRRAENFLAYWNVVVTRGAGVSTSLRRERREVRSEGRYAQNQKNLGRHFVGLFVCPIGWTAVVTLTAAAIFSRSNQLAQRLIPAGGIFEKQHF
jgi:hypothetical protein